MKILWVAPEPPVAPLTGGRERARRMLEYLSQHHTVYLLTFAAAAEMLALAELHAILDGVTAVAYPPKPGRPSTEMQNTLHTIRHRFNPQAIHVQGLAMWPYAPAGSRRILDLHDVPTRLQARLRRLRRRWLLLAALQARWQHGRLQRRQQEALAQATTVITASPVDCQHLRQQYPQLKTPIVVVANGISLADWPPAQSPPHPATVLFPGALNWPPNVDAARVLVQEVLPLVQKQIAGVRVILAGRRPPAVLAKVAQRNTAVSLIANPTDMRPLFAQATVVAVPLRAATGTRLKILQALASRRAVASTPVGAEGLPFENGKQLAIAPLVAPFAQALVTLLATPAQRQKLAENGRIAVARYDWQHHLPTLDQVYET